MQAKNIVGQTFGDVLVLLLERSCAIRLNGQIEEKMIDDNAVYINSIDRIIELDKEFNASFVDKAN